MNSVVSTGNVTGDFSAFAGFEGLLRAAAQDQLPRGLVARAEPNRASGDNDNARADLDQSLAPARETA